MLDDGQRAPIPVRTDSARFVLVDGLHRLEAAKALGKNRRRPSCLRVDALNSRLLHRSRTGPSSRVSNEPVQIKN
jgi:ParB-like nuclease family protein